jgi:hypothetical protein
MSTTLRRLEGLHFVHQTTYRTKNILLTKRIIYDLYRFSVMLNTKKAYTFALILAFVNGLFSEEGQWDLLIYRFVHKIDKANRSLIKTRANC